MELKDRIIQESSTLFFNNGIKSITMSDIASHLGISKRTLYEVFKDKEDLLDACIKKSSCEGDCEMKEILENSENALDAIMKIYAKHLSQSHNMNKSVIRDLKKYHPKLFNSIDFKQKENVDNFIPLFDKGVKQGLIRDDIKFEILLWLLKSQFKTLMESDFIPIDKYHINDFFEAAILNFTRGIATLKGLEFIEETIKNIKTNKNNV